VTSGTGLRTYLLGPKLVEMGFLARETLPVVQAARRHLEALATLTQGTVHLGISEGTEVLYLDKISGQRGLEMRSGQCGTIIGTRCGVLQPWARHST
jgi:DNA-binding IclR family transcriptional regulator